MGAISWVSSLHYNPSPHEAGILPFRTLSSQTACRISFHGKLLSGDLGCLRRCLLVWFATHVADCVCPMLARIAQLETEIRRFEQVVHTIILICTLIAV